MSRYMDLAKQHMEQIQHFYDYAGSSGYSQAGYDFRKLGGLVRRAAESKNDKSDAPIIHRMYSDARLLMEEMEKREKPKSQ